MALMVFRQVRYSKKTMADLINTQNLIKVELTEADALLFVEFQKRFTFMKLLESLNVFSIKSGSFTVHFNNLGEIQKVDVNRQYKA